MKLSQELSILSSAGPDFSFRLPLTGLASAELSTPPSDSFSAYFHLPFLPISVPLLIRGIVALR